MTCENALKVDINFIKYCDKIQIKRVRFVWGRVCNFDRIHWCRDQNLSMDFNVICTIENDEKYEYER